MGLDYSYVTIFKKVNKLKLTEKLLSEAVITDFNSGKCATINFRTDKEILQYTKRMIRQTEGINLSSTLLFKTSKFPSYYSGNLSKIGCIYINEESFDETDLLMVSFTAATSAMSILFQNSLSIKQWFIGLSIEIDAITTFIDLENDGLKFIYNKSEIVNALITDNTETASPEYEFYKKISTEYKRLTYNC